MGLEKLKSVFKEGFPGPANGWPNTHDTGFKLNSGEGSKTQFILGDTLPVLDSIQRGSSYQFVSEDLPFRKLYDDEFFDPRVGRPRGPIYNINTYEGTRFDDGVGGLFNQTQRYYGGFGNINTPKFTDIINSGNVTAKGGGYPNLTGLLERYENINPQNESLPKPEGYLKAGKINTNRTWTQSSIPQFNDLYSTARGQEKRTITIDLANDLKAKTLEGTSWETLYNPEHTAKEGVGYHYPNVSRDNLNLRYSSGGGLFGDPRTQLFGLGAGEPYIISEIPPDGGLKGGRLTNFASRDIPFVREATDTLRLTKYLSSPAGLAFIAKQNLLGLNSEAEWPLTLDIPFMGRKTITVRTPQRFGTLYNPLSTLAAATKRTTGLPFHSSLVTRSGGVDDLLKKFIKLPIPKAMSSLFSVDNIIKFTYSKTKKDTNITFGGYHTLIEKMGGPPALGLKMQDDLPRFKKSGDKLTIAGMIKGISLQATLESTVGVQGGTRAIPVNIEAEKEGMPFYFKDLRDDTYIFFRAYVESITENISPSWSSQNYIGRSEPVYVYERSERDVSFTLKLFAQTSDELDSIYQKMNRLTSMCYPQYVQDTNLNNKLRMKPPLAKFRLGELFGSKNNEMLGFLKSCAYSYPDSSPWETEVGKRVPKHIMVSITYQVIHMEVPSLDFARKYQGNFLSDKNEHTFHGITSPQNSDLLGKVKVGQGI